jgi:Putative zinc-finger
MLDFSMDDSPDGRRPEACPPTSAIVELLTRELPPDDREVIQAHVMQCPDCLAELMALRLSLRISIAARKPARKAGR